MTNLFDGLPFGPADILLPQDCEYAKWSVVACDQIGRASCRERV